MLESAKGLPRQLVPSRRGNPLMSFYSTRLLVSPLALPAGRQAVYLKPEFYRTIRALLVNPLCLSYRDNYYIIRGDGTL